MSRKSNLKERLVAVIMADGYHNLDLIEVRARVRLDDGDPLESPYRIDRPEVERKARTRLAELGKDPNKYDFVGALVAHTESPLNRGRIMWATEVEPLHVDV